MRDKIVDVAFKWGLLALIGGAVYALLEVFCRGFSHWSMIILGGVCFVAVGLLNEILPWDMPLCLQMVCGSIIITALEFCCGCIVNIGLGWAVWDYSGERFNLLGQICLKFSVLWFFVSAVAIVLDDWLRWKIFGEEKPHYTLF